MNPPTPPSLPANVRVPNASKKQAIAIAAIITISVALFWIGYELLYWNAHRPVTESERVAIQKSIDERWNTANKPDDFGKGWELGYKMGYGYAQARGLIPTEEALKSASHEISSHSNSIIDKEQFDRGYYGGFSRLQGSEQARILNP
jgi:hypothetical protein